MTADCRHVPPVQSLALTAPGAPHSQALSPKVRVSRIVLLWGKSMFTFRAHACITADLLARYIESLKRRVSELEQDVRASEEARARTTETPSNPQQHDSPGIEGQESASENTCVGSAERRPREAGDDDASVQATMGAIDFLSHSAMAQPRANSGSLSQKLTLDETITAALTVDGHDPSAAYAPPSSPLVDSHSGPLDRETTWEYVERFLDLYPLVPYLDRDLLLRQYEGVIGREDNNIPPLHRFNVCMAIAISILLTTNSSRLTPWAVSLHSASTKLFPAIVRSGRPLDALHCIHLLIVYSLFSPSGGSSWHLIGLAIRVCITMGLHKEPSAQAGLTADEMKERRWLFWSIYILDRLGPSLRCDRSMPANALS